MKSKKIICIFLCALSLVLLTGILSACGAGPSTSSAAASPSNAPSATAPGSAGSQTYTNDAAKFTITYPQSYNAMSQDQIYKIMSQLIDNLKSQHTDPAELNKAIQNSVPVAIIRKHPQGYSDGYNSGVSIGIHDDIATGNIVDFENQELNPGSQPSGGPSISPATAVKIDGKDAAFLDETLSVDGKDMFQRTYYVENNNFLLMITLTAANKSELDELVQIVDSIKFK